MYVLHIFILCPCAHNEIEGALERVSRMRSFLLLLSTSSGVKSAIVEGNLAFNPMAHSDHSRLILLICVISNLDRLRLYTATVSLSDNL